MLNIEIGKKYLDNHGDSWTVIGGCQFFPHLFKAAKDNHLSMGPERFHVSGESFSPGVPNLVSEVPSPATTTPQEPTKFKVGDRVNFKGRGQPGVILDEWPEEDSFLVEWDDGNRSWPYDYELEHLTDTPTTPSPVQCSCPTVVLMRDGCKCGHARKEIEQEFKREGWG